MEDTSRLFFGRRWHFVLVHGAGHGAWCWYKVRQILEDWGHRVSCADLTSAGIDTADPNAVLTFAAYNRPLREFMSQLPANDKVILVGHSAGGLSVTQSISEFKDKIEAAIYVTAVMLKSGFTTPQDIEDGVPDLSEYGDILQLTFGNGPDSPPTSVYLPPEYQREIISHLSPKEDSTLASMLLRPWPATAMLDAKLTPWEQPNDEVRRVYVKTQQDRVLKPERQQSMIQRWPPTSVRELKTDHCPFFSAPTELADMLLSVANANLAEEFLRHGQDGKKNPCWPGTIPGGSQFPFS